MGGALPKVCVIGAGSSGIAAAKALHERGIPFDCYEKRHCVGGLWAYGKEEGSAAYQSLHINTSKPRTQFSDFPMPAEWPDFAHHTQMAAYFDAYVDHFGFRDRIQFGTGVERADLRSDGLWAVRLQGGRVRLYDFLVVANGHHWNPQWPDPAFPGEFHGVQMHSHSYVDNTGLAGKNVLVLGIGNSAADIAVESSFVAKRTYLAMRRGAHILPKFVFGRPYDQTPNPGWVPWKIRQWFLQAVLKLATGGVERYGLPRPDHRFGEAHPTVSDYLAARVRHGDITVKPNVAELLGDRVRFVDGSAEPVDVIIYCTGYKVTFPFFDEAFLSAPENRLPLFRRVFKPELPNLAFIGLLQPLGSIMPLAEAQGRWVAQYLTGQYALPAPADMKADMERAEAALQERYVTSRRHTMQVDFEAYLYDLGQEVRRGAARAGRLGGRLPVEGRAEAVEAVVAG